jgi:hypothetical protein
MFICLFPQQVTLKVKKFGSNAVMHLLAYKIVGFRYPGNAFIPDPWL